jgi:hypothetical protein
MVKISTKWVWLVTQTIAPHRTMVAWKSIMRLHTKYQFLLGFHVNIHQLYWLLCWMVQPWCYRDPGVSVSLVSEIRRRTSASRMMLSGRQMGWLDRSSVGRTSIMSTLDHQIGGKPRNFYIIFLPQKSSWEINFAWNKHISKLKMKKELYCNLCVSRG